MQNWWYAKGGERRGPVSLQQLKQLAATGEVAATDLVWTKGMAQWQPMRQVADLTAPAPAPAAVAPAPSPVLQPGAPRLLATEPAQPAPAARPPARPPVAPVQMPVEQPRVGAPEPQADNGEQTLEGVESPVPKRAVATLRGHAVPTGDVTNWPISDVQFAELREALSIRRRILSAAAVYDVSLLLGLIAALLLGLAAGFLFFRGDPAFKSTASVLGAAAAVIAAGSAIVGLCGRFTRRSHQWAPLALFVICLALIGLTGYITFEAFRGAYAPQTADLIVQTAVGVAVLLTVLIVFAFISWRAFAAIPHYRNQPAWCQELIAAAGV